MKLATLALLLLIGCAPVTEDPVGKSVPQVNPTYCVTEIATEAGECDADHLMVMHCSTAVQPPNFSYCYDSKSAAYGLIWCCKPSFAEACGEQCD